MSDLNKFTDLAEFINKINKHVTEFLELIKEHDNKEKEKAMIEYGENLSAMVLYEYELLLLELKDCNFKPHPKLKQRIIDAVDGDYIEKSTNLYNYYKGRLEND
jgi:hypothetical protein